MTVHIGSADDRGHLTKTQVARLLKPVREDRVEKKQGLTYIPQHEVRAELMRIFGPGNVDHTMHHPELLYETMLEAGHPQFPKTAKSPVYWVTGYLVGCTLSIRDYQGRPVAEFTEYHAEENAPLPNRGEAHAMAVTSAQSYALRRAAISMGDAFGLHLYNGGSLAALVGGSLMLQGDPDSPFAERPSKPSESAGTSDTPQAAVKSPDAGADQRGAGVQRAFKQTNSMNLPPTASDSDVGNVEK